MSGCLHRCQAFPCHQCTSIARKFRRHCYHGCLPRFKIQTSSGQRIHNQCRRLLRRTARSAALSWPLAARCAQNTSRRPPSQCRFCLPSRRVQPRCGASTPRSSPLHQQDRSARWRSLIAAATCCPGAPRDISLSPSLFCLFSVKIRRLQPDAVGHYAAGRGG
eukprot:SAG11_NODE_17_length_26125_cov_45.892723_10_plen_163_part_00